MSGSNWARAAQHKGDKPGQCEDARRNNRDCRRVAISNPAATTAAEPDLEQPMKKLFVTLLCGTLASAAPALAQTNNNAPGTNPPAASSGTEPSAPVTSDSVREMMRQMMQEMMPERERRAERGGRDGDRWEHRRGGDRFNRRAMRREMRERRREEGRRGPMHDAGMRVMFAIVDADGNGRLSLQEAQDFQRRIFNAVDANRDGEIEVNEISGFVHPFGKSRDGENGGPDNDPDVNDTSPEADGEQPQDKIELKLAPDQPQ